MAPHKLMSTAVVPVLLAWLTASPASSASGWYPQTSPVTGALSDVDFVDANTGWICGAGGVILHTSNGGATWVQQASGTTSDLTALSFVSANLGFACGQYVVLRTTDGGANWQTVLLQGPPPSDPIAFSDVHALDAQNIWAVGHAMIMDYGAGGIAVVSTDGGSSWSYKGVSCSLPSCHTEMCRIFALSPQVAFVSGVEYYGYGDSFGHLWKTSDGGNTFVNVGNPLGAGEIQFLSPSVGYRIAGMVVGNIDRTTDGGASWTTTTVGDAAGTLHFVDANRGWVVGYGGPGCTPLCGIARTTDGGATWTPQASGTTQLLNAVDFVDPWVGAAVGSNGTILHTVTGGESGAEVAQTERDGGLRLLAPVPNPFSRTVQVGYAAPAGSPVTLGVFDVAGRLVRTLYRGSAEAGLECVVWDGSDASGRRAAPGMYFVRLTTLGEGCRQPLLLVR